MLRNLIVLFFILLISVPVTHAQETVPADLYYLARDAQGIAQVWRLTPANAQPQALTAESVDVTDYALSPARDRLAYIAGGNLLVSDVTGANRQLVTPIATQRAPNQLTIQLSAVGSSVSWSAENTWLTFHDELGVWVVPANASSAPRQIIAHAIPATDAEIAQVCFHLNPRWSRDGSQLLITAKVWEGLFYETVTIATGSLTQFPQLYSSDAMWTVDNQIVAWFLGGEDSQHPSLYLLNPANPAAALVELIPSGRWIKSAVQTLDGAIYIVRATSTNLDAQYDIVETAPALGQPFASVTDTVGGYVVNPQFLPQSNPPVIAGLLPATYENYEQGGDLALLNLYTGLVTPIPTGGPVWDVQWGR